MVQKIAMRLAAALYFMLFPTHVSHTQQPMKGFFGVNVHIDHGDSPDEFPGVVDWIRDYSDWPNFEPANNRYVFRNAENESYDSLYLRIKSLGTGTLLVIEDIPKWISPAPQHKHAGKFAPRGSKPGMDPADYAEAAEFFYQLSARYGSKKVDPGSLLTADKISGMNVIPAIEVMNEADGDTSWGNFVTIGQYAALLNAVYDGNNGKLGRGYGIKTADPDMQVSITGLGGNLPSLKKIVDAAGRAPFDIINLHFYAFRNERENLRVAVPPEWSSLEKDMKSAVTWRNEFAPGKPVWLTEIGWDTKPNNTESVTEQESANYLIRSYLIALGAGVEKCFWYYWEDYDDKNPIIFSSMGLFGNSSEGSRSPFRLRPKLTYWYLAFMKQLLGDMNYTGNLSGKISPSIYHYVFESADKNTEIHAVWYCPPFIFPFRQLDPYPESETIDFDIPKGVTAVNLIEPANGNAAGKQKAIAPAGSGKARLTLTGTPVFVVLKK